MQTVTFSFGDVAQIITALAAVGAVVASLRNSRKIEEVHISVNSRMDQLIESVKSDSFKDGVKSTETKPEPPI